MDDPQRRAFLRGSAALGAALTAGGMLPPLLRSAQAVEPARRHGDLRDVQHIVIFMQENRSFDHYFGSLRGVRGFADPRAATLPDGRPVWFQRRAAGGHVLPFHLDVRNTCAQTMHDLNHDWKGSQALWANWDAWVREKTPATMGYFTRGDLPFHYALADAFTVCDGYYASLFGPTSPNRMYLFSGTSGLSVGDAGKQAIANIDDGNWTSDAARDRADFKGFSWTTYPQRLQQAGVGWKVYQEYDNFGDNTLQYFAAFRGLAHDDPLYRRGRAWAPGSTATNAQASRGEHLVAQFADDVRAGTLPAVSWIVAPYIMSEHPRATPAYGASLIARLLAVLAAHPQVWSKTVFLLNYDENDGLFDHVPAPVPALHAAQGISTVSVAGESYEGQPVGMGPRVPLLVISPWSRGGWVNSQVFDHTSVIRLLEARFGVQEPNISPWRRAIAGDLTSTLDLAGHGTLDWPRLPDTAPDVALADATINLPEPYVPAQQRLPQQERGQRPARALPYACDAVLQWLPERGVRLALDNRGAAALAFNAWGADGQTPRSYSVEPGRGIEDLWPLPQDGRYRLELLGANGFMRRVQGRAHAQAAQLDLRSHDDAGSGQLLLRIGNASARRVTAVLRDHYHPQARQRVHLDPGAQRTLALDAAAHDHWYDIEVLVAEDAHFSCRLAGHIETGRPSRSDPAMAGAAPQAARSMAATPAEA